MQDFVSLVISKLCALEGFTGLTKGMEGPFLCVEVFSSFVCGCLNLGVLTGWGFVVD